MNEVKILAPLLKFLFLTKEISKDGIINWADEEILRANKNIDYNIIELSLSRNKTDIKIIEHLENLYKDDEYGKKLYFAYLNRKLKQRKTSEKEISKILFSLEVNHNIKISDVDVYWLDDGFYLAESLTIGNVDEYKTKVWAVLSDYEIFEEQLPENLI